MYSEESVFVNITVQFGLTETSFLPYTGEIFNKTKNLLEEKIKKSKWKEVAPVNTNNLKKQISKIKDKKRLLI